VTHRQLRAAFTYLPPLTPDETARLAEARAQAEFGMSLAEFKSKVQQGQMPDNSMVRSLAILAAHPRRAADPTTVGDPPTGRTPINEVVEEFGNWRVVFTLMEQDCGIVVASLRVEAKGNVPHGGLTTRSIRRIRPALAARRSRQTADVAPAPEKAIPGERKQRVFDTAVQYVAALDRGESKPNETVARLQGRRPQQVRDDIYAARSLGILGPSASQGRPGGRLKVVVTP
jgi:hypothetical protein